MKHAIWVVGLSLVACQSPASRPVQPPGPPAPADAALALPAPIADTDPVCKPPEPADPDADVGEWDNARRTQGKACEVADNNIRAAEAAILADTAATKAVTSRAWDHKTDPRYLDLVVRRFALQPDELARMRATGVAVPSRLEMPSYVWAYHEIFQSELPVYITADSIFHAVFASHDSVVSELEEGDLKPMLEAALDDMHCALAAAAKDYPPEVARDLDLYLTVARGLLVEYGDAPSPKLGFAGVSDEAKAFHDAAMSAAKLEKVSIFGRDRLVDFTQYQPRGHYATSETLKAYFRAAMFASRLELNLVSRSSRSSAATTEPDPRETPREALDALALADLAQRTHADASFAKMDATWRVLAGAREDVSIADLEKLRANAHIASLTDPHAFEALKAEIGNGFQRTVRMHPMPEGSKTLPAIATLLGPRVVADAQALMPLAHSAVPDRMKLGVADVAYAFGVDRAKTYLAGDLAKFPNLGDQLEVSRKIIADAVAGDDLYSTWLVAIRALGRESAGTHPSFLDGVDGKDLRVNSLAAAFGQLKHNYVLVAGQPYSEFGCEIPDGYVEPRPEAYAALAAYARRGQAMATQLDPKDKLHVARHYARLEEISKILETISKHELEGRPLTDSERAWLGQVAELSQDRSAETTGYPPMYTGWYFDLFFHRQDDGMRGASFVADFFTSQEGIAYAGASAPRMGMFVVDAGGGPRVMVGPVATAYEVFGPLAQRLSDETADSLPHQHPWAASYTIDSAGVAPDGLEVSIPHEYDDDGKLKRAAETAVAIKADKDFGKATITLVDHHRVPLATRTVTLKQGESSVSFKVKSAEVDGIYVAIGSWRDWTVGDAYGGVAHRWGRSP